MSKFTQMLAASYSLSLTSAEEASRYGVREVNVEHVFLALVIDEGTAGQVLRDVGITLDAARDAVAAHHREHLESLGIETEFPGDGQIRPVDEAGIEWNERAMIMVSTASAKNKTNATSAVLREIVTDPSGTVEAILKRLGVTPDEVVARLDETSPSRARAAAPARILGRTYTVFIPAPASEVWELVSDPSRLPEWDRTLASVSELDDAWTGLSAPYGKETKTKRDTKRQDIERVSAEPHRVEWLFTFPDSPTANQRSVAIVLDDAAGGTQVTVDFAWIRGSGPRGIRRVIAPVTRLLARPVVRIALWFQVTALANGISRTLRA